MKMQVYVIVYEGRLRSKSIVIYFASFMIWTVVVGMHDTDKFVKSADRYICLL